MGNHLIDAMMEKGPGGANNPHGLGGKSCKTEDEIVNVDNVHVDSSEARPTGNTAAAGIRRLSKAAEDKG